MRLSLNPTRPGPVRGFILALAATLLPATTWAQQMTVGSTHVREVYDRHNRAASAARSIGDWATVRRHASAVDSLFNGNPATLMSIARAAARLGDTTAAIEIVRTVVSMGVVRNLAGDEDLAPLRSRPEWKQLLSINEANASTAGELRELFAIPTVQFIAEDIVPDAGRGRYLVSSVRRGTVVAVHHDGIVTPFIDGKSAGGWGMFALGVDTARSRLWATTVAMPHVEGYAAGDSGKSAVLRFDLATGMIQKRYDLPAKPRGSSAGDIAIAPNGDAFVSDSRSGIVYVIESSADSLGVLVPEGIFMSPQGPALSADGKLLYVADYVRGIAQVDLETRVVRWLRHAGDVALSGIDGLTFVSPDRLIAIQNGVFPNRIIGLTIDYAAGSVLSARVLAQDTSVIREPTHGFVLGGDFVFIANSGWDGFDDSGTPRANHKFVPPVVAGVRMTF